MRTMPRVLIVEDEAPIAELIAVNLRHNGFQPTWAMDSETAQRDLDAGADDYIIKPFSTKEMLARIRAVLRRRAPEQVGGSVAIGPLLLDAPTHRVSYDGQMLKMGPTEFKLLHYFMKNAERVHSRGQLLDKVWGDHVFIEERTVDVHVKRLREALGVAGVLIETVRGAGYRLTAQPMAQPMAQLQHGAPAAATSS